MPSKRTRRIITHLISLVNTFFKKNAINFVTLLLFSAKHLTDTVPCGDMLENRPRKKAQRWIGQDRDMVVEVIRNYVVVRTGFPSSTRLIEENNSRPRFFTVDTKLRTFV